MVSYTASFSPTRSSSSATETRIGMGVDLGRDPVFLDGDIRDSVPFAQLMLALGEVVKLDERSQTKDNSAYQEWVANEYLKELSAELGISAEKLPALLEKREKLKAKYQKLSEESQTLRSAIKAPRRDYYSWLLKNNRALWMVLDPIVSVHPDKTYFEAFSADESVYARVTLPHEAVEFSEPPQLGTTNIDFSLDLEREFYRARNYRPLHLNVGLGAVELSTAVTTVREKKIDLPESWVKGLVEVQAALSLASTDLVIDSWRLADVLAMLEGRRETEGPRSLLFELKPGEPVSVVVEPWNDRVLLSSEPWKGKEPRSIKVWGRRRLRVLTNLLTITDSVSVRLLDSGMPSFWSVQLAGIGLTIGLSGWSAQDWAGHTRFSAFVPRTEFDITDVHQARFFLKTSYSANVSTVATNLNIKPSVARALLQHLCQQGVAMFDPDSDKYLARELFPNGEILKESPAGLEESRGLNLAQQATFSQYTDELTLQERTVSSLISYEGESKTTLVRFDSDGRATFGECTCNYFRYNKLKKGPCRHMVALVVKSS
jgi:hypothetical protein